MKLKKLISGVLSFLLLTESCIQVFALNGTVSYSPDGPTWTNTDVTATLSGDYDSIDNNGGSNTYVFTDNGSFSFDYSSGGVESGSTTANVSWIDKTTPSFNGVEEGAIYTGAVSINFADDHLSGATLNGSPYNDGDIISAIDTYYFEVKDLAGNTTGVNFQITSPIDIIAPTASIEYTPTLLTSGDVLAIITGFSETITGLNATGYLFTDNGTFDFSYRDLAGNTGTTTATVNRIDKAAPTATITYSISTDTNQDVIATISGFSEDITGLNTSSYIFTDNGSFSFTYQDQAGNLTTSTATVTWIDKTPITASVVYSPSSRTNTDVIASLTGFNKANVTVLGGNGFTFSSNGSHLFEFQDAAGNTGNLLANVSWIDKTSPSFAGITNGASYNTPVSITFSDNNPGVIATINGLPYNGETLSGRGTQTLLITDVAGNTTGATFTIDTTTPTIALNGATPVTLEVHNTYTEAGAIRFDNNLTGGVLNIIGGINTNILGTYTRQYSYSDGLNTGSTTRDICIVDTTAPIITLNGNTTITGERTFAYSEAGATRSDNYDGAGTVSTIYGSVNINTIGSYLLTYQYVDTSGNTGFTTRIVNIVDTIIPTASIHYSTSGFTNQDTVATITGRSETITGLNTPNYTFTGNGSFVFSYQDLAGNTGTTTATINRIDKTTPTTTDNAPLITGKNNVTITLSPVDTGAGLSGTYYCVDTGASCTPNLSGTSILVSCAAGTLCEQYVRYFSTDKAGNSETIKTTNKIIIDKTVPTASILYTPTSGVRTNTNIVAGITGFSESITGLNATGYTFSANGSYTFTYQDLVGNTGTTIATVNRIDKTNPTIATAAISSGSTGNNGATLYYNGIISLKATAADAGGAGLSGASCQYTLNGSTWNTANYTAGYCFVDNLTPAANLSIRFRIQDTAGNLGVGNTGTYLFDNIAPITNVLPASSTGNTDITATLSTVETGVGILSTQYCIDTTNTCTPSIIGTTANITGASNTIITKYLRYRSTDKLNNQEPIKSIAYTIDKVLPILTGSITVSSNNTTNSNYANTNDILTLAFTTNKPLAALPTLTISGGSLSNGTVTALGGNSYTASYTMKTTDLEGVSKFTLNMTDTVGNTGITIITGTTFDKTNPSGLSITAPILGHYVNGTPATYTITWNTGNDQTPTSIKLEYSITNFASSILITGTTTNNGSYMFSFPNTLDTIGKLRLTATDSAGNTFITTGTDFIFDNTAPTNISIDYPGLFIKGNSTYPLTRSGGIDANPQSITIYYSTDGTNYTAIPSCTKTNNEQSCLWTTPNLNTSTVTLRAIAKDKLNQTVLWTTPSFTIDSVQPTLTFTGNSNRRNTPITGSASSIDALAGLSGTILYNTLPYTNSCDTGSSTAPYYTTDGIRTGYACISDKAGNTKTGAMSYSIDQSAPTLLMNTGTIITNTGIIINITGIDLTSGISGYQRSKISGSGTISFSSTTGTAVKLSASANDNYIIQVVAKDKTNNTTTGTFTFIWDTTAPILTGTSLSISNKTASYTFSADTTGNISYTGSCGIGSLASTKAGTGNTTSRTLPNGLYSGCTLSIQDEANNKTTLAIPSFTINYTAPSSSLGGGGGGGGSSDDDSSSSTGSKASTGSSSTTTGVTLSPITPEQAYTYTSKNKILPSSLQKNYSNTGIVTKQFLKSLLNNRNKSIKKISTNITIFSTTGTNFLTRDQVAKTLIKFFWNQEPTSGTNLQELKIKGIISNTSYPKNRELNGNLLIMLTRFHKLQTSSKATLTTTGTIQTGTLLTGLFSIIKPAVTITTPQDTTAQIGSETNDTTDIQRTSNEQKFIANLNPNFQFSIGFKKNESNAGVKYLQYVLKSLGYYQGTLQGTNNNATVEALYQRQLDNKLITNTDDPAAGYLGPKTRDTLNIILKNLLSK